MPAMTEQKFAEFFAVMAGIFGHKWLSQYGENPDSITARVWNDGLDGLSLQQISTGIRYFKNHSVTGSWPPAVPEFRRVALGVPSLAALKADLRNGITSPFARMAWLFIDYHRWRSASANECDRLAADAYTLACEAIERGEPMPEESKTIEHDAVAAKKAENALYDKRHKERMRELNQA